MLTRARAERKSFTEGLSMASDGETAFYQWHQNQGMELKRNLIRKSLLMLSHFSTPPRNMQEKLKLKEKEKNMERGAILLRVRASGPKEAILLRVRASGPKEAVLLRVRGAGPKEAVLLRVKPRVLGVIYLPGLNQEKKKKARN